MKTDARPLYLNGHEPLRVFLDGPALRVCKAHSDDRRYPLSRLSRVVACGNVGWSPPAFLACSNAGIVLCFLRPDGLPDSSWIGKPSTNSTFAEDWRHFLDRPCCNRLFRQWRSRARWRATRFCALQLGMRHRERAVLRQVGDRARNDARFRAAKRVLYGLAYARSLEELAKLGLCNTDPSLSKLVPDLTAVAQWALHPALCDSRNHEALLSMPNLRKFFENHRAEVEFHMHDTLRSLSRLLREAT